MKMAKDILFVRWDYFEMEFSFIMVYKCYGNGSSNSRRPQARLEEKRVFGFNICKLEIWSIHCRERNLPHKYILDVTSSLLQQSRSRSTRRLRVSLVQCFLEDMHHLNRLCITDGHKLARV